MKTLWEHERELETLYIELDKADKTDKPAVDAINHAIFMKAAFIDQNFFQKIPLENNEH